MLEDKFAQHDKVIVDKTVFPDDEYYMSPRDYVVRPQADAESGPFTLYLPRVADAKGRLYSIVCRNADAVNVITIADRDDSECWLADIEMDGKCDRVLMYSDGMCWHALGVGGVGDWPGLATTVPPGTVAPTTLAPTTAAPTTAAPTTTLTNTPTTTAPITTLTNAPRTVAPITTLTNAPTTLAPTTLA